MLTRILTLNNKLNNNLKEQYLKDLCESWGLENLEFKASKADNKKYCIKRIEDYLKSKPEYHKEIKGVLDKKANKGILVPAGPLTIHEQNKED